MPYLLETARGAVSEGERGVLQSVFGSCTASPCSEPASRAGRLAAAPDVDG